MGKLASLVGERFDQLLVMELVEVVSGRGALWLCRCDCGRKVVKPTRELKRGAWTQRCRACTDAVMAAGPAIKHGGSNTPLFKTWSSLRERCSLPSHKAFHYYGGKGVRVCDEWLGFPAFRDWAMANGYEDRVGVSHGERLSIDRINSEGNYEPGNCRWITVAENSRRSAVAQQERRRHLRVVGEN